MSVDDLFQTLAFCANKFINGGNLTTDEFNRIINVAQWNFLNWILGQFQDYQMGRPGARVEFGVTMTVRERLTPLIGELVSINVDATGAAPWPPDYQRWDALFTQSNGIPTGRIRPAQQHRLYSMLASTIDPINTNPIWLLESNTPSQGGGNFRIYPNTNYNGTTIGSLLLSYVKTPPTINWASVNDPTTGIPTYTATGSVDPVWFETDWWLIASRAGQMIGLNLEAQQLMGYFESVIKQGA